MDRRHTLRLVSLTLVCTVVWATAPARADAAADVRTVALLPLLGSGLALDELTSADAAIQREVDLRYGERSLPAPIVRERLEEGAKRGLRCDRSLESCQAQLGIVCDTDLVLIASLAPTAVSVGGGAGGFTLTLRVVDVAEAAQLAFATSTYPGLPSSADVRKLIAKLDHDEARKALLVVTGPSGAPVVVDGAARGSLPLPKPLELAIGRHEVVVHTSPPHVTTVTLRRGERVDVAAPAGAVVQRAPPSQPPETPPETTTPPTVGDVVDSGPPTRLATIAGGGTLAGLGGVALVVGLVPWFTYAGAVNQLQADEQATIENPSYVDEGDNASDIAATYKSYQQGEKDWNSWGQIAVITGSAALVVGGTILVVGLVALE